MDMASLGFLQVIGLSPRVSQDTSNSRTDGIAGQNQVRGHMVIVTTTVTIIVEIVVDPTREASTSGLDPKVMLDDLFQ